MSTNVHTEYEIPWPRPGDKLFRPGSYHGKTAWFNWPSDRSWAYTNGFRRAAELLMEAEIERTYELDHLVYPVVFLYRHFVELSLKDVIYKGSVALGKMKSYGLAPQGHNVQALWRECRSLIEERYEAGPDESLDTVESQIDELFNFDPDRE